MTKKKKFNWKEIFKDWTLAYHGWGYYFISKGEDMITVNGNANEIYSSDSSKFKWLAGMTRTERRTLQHYVRKFSPMTLPLCKRCEKESSQEYNENCPDCDEFLILKKRKEDEDKRLEHIRAWMKERKDARKE